MYHERPNTIDARLLFAVVLSLVLHIALTSIIHRVDFSPHVQSLPERILNVSIIKPDQPEKPTELESEKLPPPVDQSQPKPAKQPKPTTPVAPSIIEPPAQTPAEREPQTSEARERALFYDRLESTVKDVIRESRNKARDADAVTIFDPRLRRKLEQARRNQAKWREFRKRQEEIDDNRYFEYASDPQHMLVKIDGKCWMIRDPDSPDDPFAGLMLKVLIGPCQPEKPMRLFAHDR